MISLESLAQKVKGAATAVSKMPNTDDEQEILLSRFMEMDYLFESEMTDIDKLSKAHLL